MIDIDAVRADTPAAANQVFMNSAGASLMPHPVLQVQRDYLDVEAAIGGYAAADRHAEALDAVYGSVARLIRAAPDEIALMESATAAWKMAFYSLALQPGDVVLSCEAEYAANYVGLLHVARTRGIRIEVVPSDPISGEVDVRALQSMIDRRVKLISLTWVPTNGGLVNPAAEVGRVARGHGIPYLLDACQAVGQLPVDVESLGCDMLTATGRKFLRGPRGTGFLYMRRAFMAGVEPHTLDHSAASWESPASYRLRDDARRFESWEAACGARLGLGAAVDYALGLGLPAIASRNAHLAGLLRAGLSQVSGVRVHDLGRTPCAIVSFSVGHRDAGDIARAARAAAIAVSVSAPASTLLDARRRALPSLVRASPHYFNTEEDVARMIAFVRAL